MVSSDPYIWLAALLTLSMLSVIYKDQKIYRFAEYSLVGSAMGHYLVMAYESIQTLCINPIIRGQSIYIVTLVLGVAILFRLSRQYAWIARYPTALLLGIGSGLALGPTFGIYILEMVKDNIFIWSSDPFTVFSNLVNLMGFIAVICFFLFTTGIKTRSLRFFNNLSKYYMMVFFGVMFMSMLFSVSVWFSGRIEFLIWDWLGLS